MKTFNKYFLIPIVTAIAAGALYLLDCALAGIFREGATFLWVAFISWTVFYGSSINERVRGLIGVVIGFLVAVIMMLITGSFTLNILTISISCLLGILIMNFLVMFLNHTKKFWTNSVSGVFVGIALTFSGLGVGMNPLNSVSEAFTILGVLVVYTILGLIAGFFSIYYTNKANKKLESEPSEKTEETK